MTDYGLKIGMTTSEVKALVAKTNASDKTKQFIFNFCNNDLDGKITDEIELHILNTWASGQEKIPMPKLNDKEGILEQYISQPEIESAARRIECNNGKHQTISYSSLRDYDKDGYADKYSSYYTPENVQHHGIDRNLDGNFDIHAKSLERDWTF